MFNAAEVSDERRRVGRAGGERMTDQPPTPETTVYPTAGTEDPLDPEHRRMVAAMLAILGGPPLSRDEELRFKRAQIAYFYEEGVGPPPEDVTLVERAAEEAPPWFDVEMRSKTLEREEAAAEIDEMLTKGLTARGIDVAEMTVLEKVEAAREVLGLDGDADADADTDGED